MNHLPVPGLIIRLNLCSEKSFSAVSVDRHARAGEDSHILQCNGLTVLKIKRVFAVNLVAENNPVRRS